MPDENAEELALVNLDSNGITNTLHILESIAAEGKGWIHRNQHTEPS